MRVRTFAVLIVAGAAAGALMAQTPQDLEKKLGRDPLELLREIGSVRSDEDVSKADKEAIEGLDGQERLALLRLGLGSSDERVVFGAVLRMPEQLAVPELRNAARIVLPRLGDADCPVVEGYARQLLGSVDMAATATAMRKLSASDADLFAGGLHRMVRGEHVPALCELALATKGVTRRAVFSNARMAAEYSDEHVPLLVATWLQMRGAKPDPDGDGLPGLLAAALRTHLDAPPPRELAKDELDDRDPSLPVIPCMRWLAKCKASPKDLPLLKRLVAGDSEEGFVAALRALGGMSDAQSLEVLRTLTVEEYRRQPLQAARAQRGDATALEALLAGDNYEVCAGLAVASPERRRAFASRLLALPLDDALALVRGLAESTRGDPMGYMVPPYDDAWLADLEPMIAAKKDIDARLLRALVGTVPGCATARLADALLARPAAELFAPDGESDEQEGWTRWRGDLGYSGVWAFLEATRPDALRQRLREGQRGSDAACSDRCARMLTALGDTEDVDRLVAWIGRAEDPEEHWLQLGRTRHPNVVAALRARANTPKEGDDLVVLLRALATALGMPHAFAPRWSIAENDVDAVRVALLGGDAASAFLRSATATTGIDTSWALLASWREPRVQNFVRERRRHPELDACELVRFDLRWALYAKDDAVLKEAQQLVHDGRYAMHYGMDEEVRCLDRDLATLPFWINELGGNCCRACVAEEVMHLFFREKAHAFDCQRMAEPAYARLRRRLLPLQNRLRWSRIADAFVVAGI